MCARQERGEGSSTLKVLVLGTEVVQSERAEFNIWDMPYMLPQVSYLVANDGKDTEPVATRRLREGCRMTSMPVV